MSGSNTQQTRTNGTIVFLSGYNLDFGIPADKTNFIRDYADGTLAEVRRDFLSLSNERIYIRPELYDTEKPRHRDIKNTITPLIGNVFHFFSIEVYCQPDLDDPNHRTEKIELVIDMGAFEKVIKVVDKLFPGSIGWRNEEPFVIFESKLAQVTDPSEDQKIARYRLRFLINEARRQQKAFDAKP